LKLTSISGIACVAAAIPWNGGPLTVDLMTRHIRGDVPHLCIAQVGLNRCATLPALPAADSWTSYRTTFYPEAGAVALVLYLTAGRGDPISTNDFASVKVTAVPIQTSKADAPLAQPLRLTVSDSGYSEGWSGPSGGEHVVVDGLFNGWITTRNPGGPVSIRYARADLINGGYVVSLMAIIAMIAVGLVLAAASLRSTIRPTGRHKSRVTRESKER
jgi:hypothetical protein